MYVEQAQLKNIEKLLEPNKAVVILGPRRCGKTTLLNHFSQKLTDKYLFVNGEDIYDRKYLSSGSIAQLKNFMGDNSVLIIDEAQKIENIGLNMKLILDHIKGIKVIATGSSAFNLLSEVGEPLTGRKYTLKLYPLSQMELDSIENPAERSALLETRMIYGAYPEVVLNKDNRRNMLYLREIVDSYLYRDILEMAGVRRPDKIIQLLQLLAFQIGKEVSFAELGAKLGMSKNSVERYCDLLEKSFVIYRLRGFSRNLRKEITKNPRCYFYDNGVRNALINNFNPLSMRNDTGELWENYILTEMMKKYEYDMLPANKYFWRTYDQKEIDLVIERGGRLFGYEIKWSPRKVSPPKDWSRSYQNSSYTVITKDNYTDFIV